jgi:hypothetical protein
LGLASLKEEAVVAVGEQPPQKKKKPSNRELKPSRDLGKKNRQYACRSNVTSAPIARQQVGKLVPAKTDSW